MNLLLLEPDELAPDSSATIVGRRAAHIITVLRKGVGDTVRAGAVDGRMGEARITGVADDRVAVACRFDDDPPLKRALTLIVALPRPPMARRVLQHAAAMGVPRIVLLNTRRVEKSYWHSPTLTPEPIGTQLRLGLEQAGDTVLPTVDLQPRFRPFVEDRLPALAEGTRRLLAAADAPIPCPTDLAAPVTLLVGPEGGLVEFETDLLLQAGFEPVALGPRVLRVETAVVALLARLGVA